MEIVIIILFAVVVLTIYFVIQYWWVLLIFAAMLFVAILIYWGVSKHELEYLKNNLVKAKIVSSEPIVERRAENTGYTVSYGRYLSSHEHYRYRNVITGHNVTFRCYFKDGKDKLWSCKEGSNEYNIMIAKVEL